jgi:hypothetical protein
MAEIDALQAHHVAEAAGPFGTTPMEPSMEPPDAAIDGPE